jgi:hypothetical protein
MRQAKLPLDGAAALWCVLLTGQGHGDVGQPSCFAPLRPMSSQPAGQSRPDHILLSPALYGLDYSASVSDRVPNFDHVALTLSLPIPGFVNPAIAHRCSAVCWSPRSVLCWDSLKADAYVHELVRMREAGLFLFFKNICQKGDVDLACRLLMRMVEQATRAPGVNMTRLCRCPLRPKRSTAQLGGPWFDAECRILRACCRHSRLRGTPRERACLQAQYHHLLRAKLTVFIVAQLDYCWPKSVVLQ